MGIFSVCSSADSVHFPCTLLERHGTGQGAEDERDEGDRAELDRLEDKSDDGTDENREQVPCIDRQPVRNGEDVARESDGSSAY